MYGWAIACALCISVEFNNYIKRWKKFPIDWVIVFAAVVVVVSIAAAFVAVAMFFYDTPHFTIQQQQQQKFQPKPIISIQFLFYLHLFWHIYFIRLFGVVGVNSGKSNFTLSKKRRRIRIDSLPVYINSWTLERVYSMVTVSIYNWMILLNIFSLSRTYYILVSAFHMYV